MLAARSHRKIKKIKIMDQKFIGIMERQKGPEPTQISGITFPCILRFPIGTVASLPQDVQKHFRHITYQYDIGGEWLNATPEEEKRLDAIFQGESP